MKQATDTYFDITGARAFWPHVAKRFIAMVIHIPTTWYQRKADRTRLSELSPRLLLDVGITETQRFYEVNKPFWEK